MKYGLSGRRALAILFSALLVLCGNAPVRAAPLPPGRGGVPGAVERTCTCAQTRPVELRLCIRPAASGELQPARKDDSRGSSRFSACPAVTAHAGQKVARQAASPLPQPTRYPPVLHKFMRTTILRQSVF